MKSMRLFNVTLLSALSLALAGCGGGSSGAPQPAAPVNPYGPYGYNQQVSNPYVCAAGEIQLRNSAGRPTCFHTTDLVQACAQAGHMMVAGNLCRYERQLNTRVKGYWTSDSVFSLLRRRDRRRTDLAFSGTAPINVGLFSGESLKVYGDVNNDSSWMADLYYMGQPVASTSSGATVESDGGNFTLIADSMQQPNYGGYPTNYPGTQPYGYGAANQCYVVQNGVCGAGTVLTAGNQCCPAGVQPGMYGQAYSGFAMTVATPMPQSYMLRFAFDGGREASVTIRAAAIGCEDGHGNSYSCR